MNKVTPKATLNFSEWKRAKKPAPVTRKPMTEPAGSISYLKMPKNVAPPNKKPKPLPVAPRAISNKSGGDGDSQQQSNTIPGFKNKKDKQQALAKAKAAIVSGSIKPAVRPVAELCGIGTRGAQWVLSELVEAGTLERKPSGGVRLPKTDTSQVDEVASALVNLGLKKEEARQYAQKSSGESVDKHVSDALRMVGKK